AVVAGLGIGGIAVALAAQKMLGDLFSYVALVFDRPFEIGDFIIIGDHAGTIEHIGIKTTRIRSLGGEQLIFANSDLTSSRIQNYKRMASRRVVFKFRVMYHTTSQQLKEIPDIVRQIIENIDDATLDRAHFTSFGDFSLDFEVVYYVTGNDYAKYMNIQQKINLDLKEAFEQRNIEFAYLTKLLYWPKQ
ncbi:MAG: mechanosensitive ion channel family protein, partial [Sporomusa sp.]